ncbi:extracellular solute-binding protein [Paenibacillus sp. GCM10027626]|uniref:extracellular solute-binding protein n=1 Tax=Paenibacillus sp. GCM10027626 TaxID=3273411 RepID=UPI00362C696C
MALQEGLAHWEMYKEKTGVTLDVQLPSGKLQETLNLVIAAGNMPELMYMTNHADANRFGQQGALANILDYIGLMPNLKVRLSMRGTKSASVHFAGEN